MLWRQLINIKNAQTIPEDSFAIHHDSAFHFAGAPASPGSAIRKSECIKPRPRTTKRRAAYRQSFSFRVYSFRQKGCKESIDRRSRRGMVAAEGHRPGLEGSEIRVKNCIFVNSYESLPFHRYTLPSSYIWVRNETGVTAWLDWSYTAKCRTNAIYWI